MTKKNCPVCNSLAEISIVTDGTFYSCPVCGRYEIQYQDWNILKNSRLASYLYYNRFAVDDFAEYRYYYYIPNHSIVQQRKNAQQGTDLQSLFVAISMEMMDVLIVENVVKEAVTRLLPGKGENCYISDSQFIKKILNQYKALGLIYSKWDNEKGLLFWGLTKKGEKLRNDLTLMRKKEQDEVKPESK